MSQWATIFDLDGVLVQTDQYHYQSWAELAEEMGIPFDRRRFDTRMRGLARMEALEVFLGQSEKALGLDAKLAIAARKQGRFLEILAEGDLAPASGAVELLDELRRRNAKTAVGSSSRNARLILGMTGLACRVDAVVDGGEARGKPSPDIFLLAAERLGVRPDACVVVEDARDGIEAARRAKMAAVAIGPPDRFPDASVRVAALAEITPEMLLGLLANMSAASVGG